MEQPEYGWTDGRVLGALLAGSVLLAAFVVQELRLGLVLTGAGMLLLSRAGVDTGYGLIAAALSVGGLGVGIAMPPAVDAMLGTLSRTQTGGGMGLAGNLRQLAAAPLGSPSSAASCTAATEAA